ncbi:bla regulator protein blaR1 [Desulfotomaculum arcticum]|uniref:Bla regulator protein blaR1 n=1 Tax=Desulfotruncus arcticus DSM 17038 TaxID=1121424 RepID=A0A1I2XMQ8_9FIRM|nr:M56/M15 family metallopeptidase [Desulfotruncus arcticus]SFH14773.1 bla regulator protein blaR1 [Desulfotomaculum arcticum] [Desulfotruncus arcticus DSM 17038]
MEALSIIFARVLYSSLIAGIIIVLLLIVKKGLPNRLSGRVYHIIWLIVLIRLVMPFQIESPYSIGDIFPKTPTVFNYFQEYMSSPADGYSGTETLNKNGFQEDEEYYDKEKTEDYPLWNPGFLSIVWLTGVTATALVAAIMIIRLKRRSREFERVCDSQINELMQQCCVRLGIKKDIPLYMDSYFRSPCIAGIFTPGIYLPRDICNQIHRHHLEHVLLHELAHYKRKDSICNLCAAIAVMLHWFNPLVWLAIREMRYDREIATDAYVMETLGESAIIPYGNTLIKLAGIFSNRSTPLNMISFSKTNEQMERRITMIKMFKKGSYRLSALAVLCFIIIGALTFTMANGNTPKGVGNSMVNEKIKDMVVIIDPGHGGDDLGGTYPFDTSDPESTEVKEKNINLEISLLLSDMLNESGIKAVMTRQDDSTIELEKRIELANSYNAALLVSVHNEMHPDSSANGTRTLYYNSGTEPGYGITGEKAAQIIQSNLVEQLGTRDQGISNVKLKILEQVNMPAVSVAVSYITNESDREKLMTEEFRARAAQAIYDGIIEVLNEVAATDAREV